MRGRVLPAGFVPEEAPEVPAAPRDAATVVLVREGDPGLEVFLQRRVRDMAFAGGMTVFPGGGVDSRDADASIGWAGPDAAWWAQRFGCSAETARALVCAAVRETFEESGVLLAGPEAGSVVGETGRYAAARAQLETRERSLAEFLAEEGLVLRADLLRPWSNWVTPEREPRRYDTRFFLAALPEGQLADAGTSEAAEAYWSTPARALDEFRAGRCQLLPPTEFTLAELAEHRALSGLLDAERGLRPIMPKLVHRDGRWQAVLPGEPGYEEAR
ncbi:NUDIX hydrolase [Saccharopolyspora griseoalba]|uniref:NUDIX hydrolase n=1 Tax=Saccharopolyspora griseoalba TaxID=1431848 RepID=A0ABW2LME6_9PSEU